MSKRKIRGMEELLIAPIHHAPSSLLQIGSLRRLDSLCSSDLDQTTGEMTCCIVDVTLKEILDQGPRWKDKLPKSTSGRPSLSRTTLRLEAGGYRFRLLQDYIQPPEGGERASAS